MSRDQRAETGGLLPLTARQREALEHIRRIVNHTGVFPTMDQVGSAMGIGKARAHEHITELLRRGYLACEPKAQPGGYNRYQLASNPAVPLANLEESLTGLPDPAALGDVRARLGGAATAYVPAGVER